MIELTEPVPPLEIMKRMSYPCSQKSSEVSAYFHDRPSPGTSSSFAETIQLQQKQDHHFTDVLELDSVFRRKKQKSLKLMDFGFRRIEKVFSSC